MSTPELRTGPASPWIDGSSVAALPRVAPLIAAGITAARITQVQADAICAMAADAASEILYLRSGNVFTGRTGPVTVRPLSRPTDGDRLSGGVGSLGPLGYDGAGWGSATSYGAATPGVRSMYGDSEPPTVELGAYPVIAIQQVKIDGIVIPANEYELRDFRTLVRIRPSISAEPTARWGWPTSQVMDLADTELGTFSITYTYGTLPPTIGILAAQVMAEYLAVPMLGDPKKLPERATQVSRQGVTAMIANVVDLLAQKRTGIYAVDLFIDSVNPGGNQQQAAVWSPDIGRARRTAVSDSLSSRARR